MHWTRDTAKRVLANGLTVLAQRDPSARVVAVVTHVKAGYFDEPDEWVGIAHVLEHMYFKGTNRREPGQIARETQLAGGYINAATIYDKTVYYTVLPSAADGLSKALDVQADALTGAALDADELRRELQVIIEEVKRKLDTPAAVAGESLYAVLFSVHRMRRWRIGSEEQLNQLTADDLRAYYRSRYTPDRVIVGIAGDIQPDRAVALAEEYFGDWNRPSGVVPGSPPEPGGVSRAEAKILHGDVERPLAVIGWKSVDALHPDTPALDLAAAVVGSGRGSRLYSALRAPGLASSASAYHYTPTEVGVFAVSLESETDRLDRAVALAARVVGSLADVGPSDAELQRAKALLATTWSRRFESVDGRAATLCEAEALGDYHLADEMYRRTLATSVEDIRRVTTAHLDLERAGAVFYLPHRTTTTWGNGHWPPERAADTLETPHPSAIPATGEPKGRSSLTLVSSGEFPGDIVHRRYGGADVLVKPKLGSGLVSLSFHYPNAHDEETGATSGIGWLFARAALRGAGDLNAAELAVVAEGLGGAIVPEVSFDFLGWSMTVQPGALAEAAKLLRLVAGEPRLEPDQVVIERELLASDARSVRDDMLRFPIQEARGRAFPRDPYGLPALGNPETVLALQGDQLGRWADRLRRRRPVIVVVGDLAAEEMLHGVSALADWGENDGAERHNLKSPSWEPGRGDEQRAKAQTAVAMAFPACPYSSPDRYVVRVLCTMLSGLAGRLFDELRERRSLAYTVAALPWLVRRAGAVFSYIATSPKREAEAREAMLAELARIPSDPIEQVELERARQYAAGAVEVRRQSGRAVADEIMTSWIHGTTQEFSEIPRRLRAVSEDDIRRVAGSIFHADRRAEYVVRGGDER